MGALVRGRPKRRLKRRSLVSCISAHDPQLVRLADAIAQRVGQQRFHVWFNNSTRLDLKSDGLEIAVPNDFISEWISTHFTRSIQEAAHEVLGCPLPVRFNVVPELFLTKVSANVDEDAGPANGRAAPRLLSARNGSRSLATNLPTTNGQKAERAG